VYQPPSDLPWVPAEYVFLRSIPLEKKSTYHEPVRLSGLDDLMDPNALMTAFCLAMALFIAEASMKLP
jgi:hypothetical protein